MFYGAHSAPLRWLMFYGARSAPLRWVLHCENKNLDYKRELHIDTDSDKKEFLADISSFANSNGGDIIFGIEEDSIDKIHVSIAGIEYQNDYILIRRIEDFIRQSIQPIILNIEYKIIEIEKGKGILIIRISQSLIAPHRVEYKGHNKFYTRRSYESFKFNRTLCNSNKRK